MTDPYAPPTSRVSKEELVMGGAATKMPTRYFINVCVLKLGFIYLALSVVVYSFYAYKYTHGYYGTNNHFFAFSGVIPTLLYFGMIGLFLYGIFSWAMAFFTVIWKSRDKLLTRVLILLYLIIAPLIAMPITSEVTSTLLSEHLKEYSPHK